MTPMRCRVCHRLGQSSYCPTHAPTYNTRAWRTIAAAVRDRDNHRCVMCGRPCPHPLHHHVDHIDHTIPDRNRFDNLRTVCARFNLGHGKGCGRP